MTARCLLFLTIVFCGCNVEPTAFPEPQVSEPSQFSSHFDPAKTGRISGQLKWTGRIPRVAPVSFSIPRADGKGLDPRIAANPNRPHINASTRAIGDAVVYLRYVDPGTARPWELSPVSVMIGDGQIHVLQGKCERRVGFVRCGEKVSIWSTEQVFHILRARGADYFSITFPQPEEKVQWQLKHPGRVELSSGSGSSWMRADLFVIEHPYYALTDSEGRFEFEQVPSGTFEIVAWLPNWEAGIPIREPESALITRQTYAPPYECATPVKNEAGKTLQVELILP